MLNTHWDLSPLYKDFDDPSIEEDFKKLADGAVAIKTLANADLSAPADWLEQVIVSLSDMMNLFSKLGSYIMLTLAVEATHPKAAALMGRLNNEEVNLTVAMNAVNRRIASLPELDALIDNNSKLHAFRFVLKEMAGKAAHMLPEALEEPVLQMQLTGGEAWQNLRDLLDGTATVELDGKKLPLPAVRGMAYDPDPEVRKKAYEAELAAYPAYEAPMAAALNAIKGEAMTMTRLRGYDSVLDATLDESRMDRETLDALIGAIEEYLPVFRRYLKAKAEYLGHKNGLPFYDLFAPLGESHKTYTYDEAHSYLVDILGRFSPKMGAFIDHAFRNRWIDALPAVGKTGGAFCDFINYIGESRVLSNFVGSFSDVSTLAHELGHGYHGFCLKDENILNTSYPMPLAETASIFNETLVSREAMKDADSDEAFTLLEAELQDATQVIVDIYSRYIFETNLFEGRKSHTLSADELKELMLDAQRKAYGDGLDPDTLHPYMWQCKSHYYSTGLHFYNFPYAFGLLFGRGVYALYEKEGKEFLPKYDALLKGTGCHNVADTAMLMGIDVHDKAFWKTSLAGLAEDVERFVAQTEVK